MSETRNGCGKLGRRRLELLALEDSPRRAESHLAECDRCAGAVEALRREAERVARDALKIEAAARRPAPAPERLRAGILARLDEPAPRRLFLRPVFIAPLAGGLAAALIALIIVLSGTGTLEKEVAVTETYVQETLVWDGSRDVAAFYDPLGETTTASSGGDEWTGGTSDPMEAFFDLPAADGSETDFDSTGGFFPGAGG